MLGRTTARVSQIITGKQELSPEIARELATVFDVPAEVWLSRESAFRLALTTENTDEVRRRKRLYELAPVREMQKRGWVKATEDVTELERELCQFYGIHDINEKPRVPGVMRKTAPETELTPAQQAWVFRVRNIAARLPSIRFDPSRMDECKAALRKLAAYSAHTAKVPKLLSLFGIRFVIVEPLSGGKIDGVATWLSEDAPVIGLSMRYERIDNFWHTLLHEAVHIKHRDESVDLDHGEDVPEVTKPAFEKRADEEAATCLISRQELTGFIRRYGPLYEESVINQFANKLKVHPAIIVGQLQHLGEIGYSKFRDLLVKVRHIVTPMAVTDGWGHKLDSRMFT